MLKVLTGTARARIWLFGDGRIQAGEGELRVETRRGWTAEGDKARMVSTEGLQQALFAYYEPWE
jgi:hypothetical protein